MEAYDKLPYQPTLEIKPFHAQAPEKCLDDFKQLLRLSPIGPRTFENSDTNDRRYGPSRRWVIKAKDNWLGEFDWRRHEERINSFPNFTAAVDEFNEAGDKLEIHFVALFSQRPDATPLVLYHGWPGSFMEFFDVLDIIKEKYTPRELPYHVVVPSLPGYAFSSGPPLEYDFTLEDSSLALDKLLRGLGLYGYIAQGGDLGASVARYQAAKCNSCAGMHLNYTPLPRPPNAAALPVSELEERGLQRGLWFREVGAAYAILHGTRTATIGLALSTSPLAVLCWISEKFLDWTDEDTSLDTILAHATMYWITETFPRCIYPYRDMAGDAERPRIAKASGPSGYSFFQHDIMPMPASWVATSCNLVSVAMHENGGHFAAMEKPKELLADIEAYMKKAYMGYKRGHSETESNRYRKETPEAE
ncbi:Alpha/Beta hydrolase protein [Xylaria bambusicola]|uniref:Alpha/Beta hydrolase protein n=1 Tax=Xylaria bambusicola TaxID=326684 RepID=UPI0020081ED4|nr:Alpha/Beta hydrolase protein [Xylaria bambusicola]KAI0508526.1 Alpha/Beta hydrolase protein [Xylaria bambusicola]